MFDPEKVLIEVWKRLSQDETLLSLIGINPTDNLAKAKQILRTSYYEDLAGDVSRVNIFFRPSRATANSLLTEKVLQIDCHVPYNKYFVAYKLVKRIKELLHNYEINGVVLHYDSFLGELATAPNFFCASIRFSFYQSLRG